MMSYTNYDIGDFAADEFFVEWVVAPSSEHDSFWAQWLTENPLKKEILLEARLVVLSMHTQPEHISLRDKEGIWSGIKKQVFTHLPDRTLIDQKHWSRSWSWAYRAAAVVLFALAGLLVMYMVGTFDQQTAVVAFTPKGERTVVHLPDGTKVWLNSESSLTYPETFTDRPLREVTLQGEAFFDVTENAAQPFVVHIGQMEVRVLGTAFNVRAYEEEDAVETTLVRGKVMVELQSVGEVHEKSTLFLTENQQAIYSKSTMGLLKEEVQATEISAWKDGKVVFDNKSFKEIVTTLERWYGVDIQTEDTGNSDCHFSTTIENEPITKVLELFKATSEINYTIDDDRIIITGKICPD